MDLDEAQGLTPQIVRELLCEHNDRYRSVQELLREVNPRLRATLTKELLEKILEIPEGSIQIYKKRYNPSRKGEPKNRRRSHLGSDIVCAYVEDPNQSSVGFGHETSFTGLSELPSDYPFAVLTYEDPKSGLYGSQRARIVSLMGWTVTRQQSAVKITNTVDLTDLTKYGYQGSAVLD